jgi:hypothetical protein
MPLIAWLASAFRILFLNGRSLFLAFLGVYLIPWLISIAKGLGVGYVTYELGSYALDTLFGYLKDQFAGMPAEMISMLSIAKVDEAISIIFAAFAAKLFLAGFHNKNGDASTKKSEITWSA